MIKRMVATLGLGLIITYCAFPLYWALRTALSDGDALFSSRLWPAQWHTQNFVTIFAEGFHIPVINSVVVALITVIVCLCLALTASYALARLAFKGRGLLLYSILAISMFPQVAILSGMYELVQVFGLYDRLGGLILSYMLFTLPFTVWLLTTYMQDIPKELEDAALMDGASRLQIITTIFLPLLMPAMLSTGLLAFVAVWNEFLFALSFVSDDSKRTVPVALAFMTGATPYALPWHLIMAASVVVTLPLITLVIVLQKRLMGGIAQYGIRS